MSLKVHKTKRNDWFDYKYERRLFLQNEYFIVDFLMKSTIKEVVVFAMLTHLNAGLMGNIYFSSYHYPSPDRCFKFGLKWLFLN